MLPSMLSEMGWTGELWLKTYVFNWQNKRLFLECFYGFIWICCLELLDLWDLSAFNKIVVIFFGFFSRLLWLVLNTGGEDLFLDRKPKQTLSEGGSPPQKIEVGLRCRLYLLVWLIYSNFAIQFNFCWDFLLRKSETKAKKCLPITDTRLNRPTGYFIENVSFWIWSALPSEEIYVARVFDNT